MMISTKGRYALRVMVDLAENGQGGYVPLKEIAGRQDISLKYLEKILPVLVRSGMVEGIQGKRGGYRLTVDPEKCRIGDVLRLTEGTLAPVACLQCGAEPCERRSFCRTLPLWEELGQAVSDFLDGKTLADLIPKAEQ